MLWAGRSAENRLGHLLRARRGTTESSAIPVTLLAAGYKEKRLTISQPLPFVTPTGFKPVTF